MEVFEKWLADERKAKAAEAATLLEALNAFGQHAEHCPKTKFWRPDQVFPCLCGLDKALASTTAGSEMLERLRKAEARAELAENAAVKVYLNKTAERITQLETENASLRNQLGDNLCWIKDDEDKAIAQALTWPEMQESCHRYHGQISAVTGEFTGGMTIAQLEQSITQLEGVIQRFGHHDEDCPAFLDESVCDCGFKAALSAPVEKSCRWCADGKPEWSYDAKVWIHRRARLDRRCENPP